MDISKRKGFKVNVNMLIIACRIMLATMALAPLVANTTFGQQPNVLFIAVDDLRPQLGCYGDTIAITPHIDRLARQGMVFDRAYCQQAVCAPSRTSVMTGLRPDATRVWDLNTHFRTTRPHAVTLPQHFKQHGYDTRNVGKIFHDPAHAQDPISWSAPALLAVTDHAGPKYLLAENTGRAGSWKAAATECADVPDTAYVDGKVSKAAVALLRELKDTSFFLAVGFRRPHLPFSAPKRYWDLYRREDIPLPDNTLPPIGAPAMALHGGVELRGYTDIPGQGAIPLAKQRELHHGYYASISYVDAQIGLLLTEVDRLGLMDNTIIVLWSDHGFHLGELGLWCKTTNFELDTRVPLLISCRQQGVAAGHSGALVELVDIYPTLVELAGLPMPESLEGTSMVPLIANPGRLWKQAAFSQFPRPWMYRGQPECMGYSVRTPDFRYTEWRKLADGTVVDTELYHYLAGGAEHINLADNKKFEDVRHAMKQLLANGWQDVIPQDYKPSK